MAPPAKSKLIVLRLSPDKLSSFPSSMPSSPAAAVKQSESVSTPSSTDATTQPVIVEPSPSQSGLSPADATPASAAATPTANGGLAPPSSQPARRKGIPGPKPGSKRSAPSLGPDGAPKPRGKPGPKKKPRPGDPMDANGNPVGPASNIPKLGPKANTGAINAGLRALDRSGRPCKKWEKRGFSLKSFTGVSWSVSSWGHRPGHDDNGDVKSETSGKTENGSDEMNGVIPSSPATAIAA